MQAMILAAGRGERLRPLTDSCPKPLVKVASKPLIFWHLLKLKSIGINDIVVNSAHLSSMIVDTLGDGKKFGLKITHSVELPPGLETAGGIINALPYLIDDYFLVINGDVFIDGPYEQFLNPPTGDALARMFMVKNPQHHLQGDFSLKKGQIILGNNLTFSGVAVYKREGFEGFKVDRLPLKPFFLRWIEGNKAQGQLLDGAWFDVGTLERLKQTEEYIRSKESL